MKIFETKLNGVIIIAPFVFDDNRGFFFESYSKSKYEKKGIFNTFVQDNQSLSKNKGTIRGMHYQLLPKAQSKLIRVISGEMVNYVVDIRKGSPTFAQHISITLTAKNKKQLYIPKGFANGFCTLSDNCEIIYKVDDYFSPEHDRCFLWNDPDINIDWPVKEPILSERDKNAPLFKDAENNFVYSEKK